jgi:hypothetical protein
MLNRRILFVASSMLTVAFFACSDPGIVRAPSSATRSRGGEQNDQTDDTNVRRQYGPAVRVGNGIVRTYVVLDKSPLDMPLEVGVVMSETVMDGLPAPVAMSSEHTAHGKEDEHSNMHMFLLDLPQKNPTPYKFVQFDWNPVGHEPAGVYDLPHFDFHFYTVSKDVRASILPSDPQFAQKAANYPAAAFRSPFYIDAATPAGIPAAAATVPQMGLHWLDVRSPELQRMTGHPEAYKPFTTTFIYGSWDGQFIFDEPMITRAHLLAKRDATDPAVRDELIPVPTAARYSPAGFYPGAYRITYDAIAREYRVALTQLAWRE